MSHYSADSLEGTLKARNQLMEILAAADKPLDKWSANYQALLPESTLEPQDKLFEVQNTVHSWVCTGRLNLTSFTSTFNHLHSLLL